MNLGLKLVDSDRTIQGMINNAIAEEVNRAINKNSNKLLKSIKIAVERWIRSQPEVLSLQSEGYKDSLNAEFGLSLGQGALATEEIVNAILSTITVQIKPMDQKLKGGVTFNIQPSTFSNVLNLPSGFIFRNDGPLHWMNWLLMLGTKAIVYGYDYEPGLAGVSGGGTMVKGGIWRVPPQYSGTARDNFITRALIGNDKELESILQGIFV